MLLNVLGNPVSVFLDSNGQPLNGGSIYIGQPNTDPTNPANWVTVFQDQGLSIPLQQPIKTTNGQPSLNGQQIPVYLGLGITTYSLAVMNAGGVVVMSQPSCAPFSLGGSAAGSMIYKEFVEGTDFVGGTAPVLTLPSNFGSAANVFVDAGGITQKPGIDYTLSGTTLTFLSIVPAGTGSIGARGGITAAVGVPGAGSITDSAIATGTALYNRISTLNVKDPAYGAKGDGVTDDTAAFVKALTALATAGGKLHIPTGKYILSSALTLTLPSSISSVTIEGDGAESTVLSFGSTNGLTINYSGNFGSSARICDLSFVTSGVGAGTALTLNQSGTISNPANSALNEIIDVTIRGQGGFALGSSYWTTGIAVNGVSNINFIGLVVIGPIPSTPPFSSSGIGVTVGGTLALIPVVFNFSGCTFNYLNVGFQWGNYTQGVTFSQCNFTANAYGILIPTGVLSPVLLTVLGCQFNCGAQGILDQIGAGDIIHGCLFIVPNVPSWGGTGIQLQNSVEYSIVGNAFNIQGSQGAVFPVGVVIGSSISPYTGITTGNQFNNMKTAILLEAASSGANVQSNAYSNNGANVTNSGTGNTVGGGSQ